MNNKGQFLLYDMLLAMIIILIVLVSTTYLLETTDIANSNTKDYKEPRYMLELLEDEGLLTKLSTALDKNDSLEINQTKEKIEHILSSGCNGDYTLSDESTNKIIINHSSNSYKEIYSRKKVVDKHEYILMIYR
ncbi:MAG: hypothetical protein IJJ11_00635 [Methanosphaera sp.]|nr:hypothetical protein [Methanosphaera sp.]